VRKNKSHQKKKGAPKGVPFVLLAWILANRYLAVGRDSGEA
jgi:hypothetical protein